VVVELKAATITFGAVFRVLDNQGIADVAEKLSRVFHDGLCLFIWFHLGF